MALGTDWSLSGSFNMLEELSCAERVGLSRGIELTAHQLWLMATYNAAYAVGLENAVGGIRQGLSADLILINRPKGMSAYQAAIGV